MTVGELIYKITADTSKFTEGAVVTKKELAAARALTEATRSPTEKYGQSVDNLGKLLRKGAISQNVYNSSVAELRKELASAESPLKGFSTLLPGSIQNLAGMAGPLAAATVAMGAFSKGMDIAQQALDAVAASVRKGLAEIDQISKVAARLDISAESLIGFQHAADLSGVGAEEFNKDLEMLAKNLGNAAVKGGPVADALASIGLDARKLAEQGLDRSFLEIADAIAAVENPTQRAALAQQLFGRSGKDLLNTLALGSQGISELAKRADLLGLTISDLDAQRVEAANDAVDELSKAWDGFGRQLAVELAPHIKDVAEGVLAMIDAFGGVRGVVENSIALFAELNAALGDPLSKLQLLAEAFIGLSLAILEAQKAYATLTGDDALADAAAGQIDKLSRIANGDFSAIQASGATSRRRGDFVPEQEGAVDNTLQNQAKAYDDIVRALQDEQDQLLGITRLQRQIEDLRQQGVDTEHLEQLQKQTEELRSQLAEEQKIKQAIEDVDKTRQKVIDDRKREAEREAESLKRRAEQLKKSVETPEETLKNRLKEVTDLFNAGLLKPSEAVKIRNAAKDEFEKATATPPAEVGRPVPVGALQRGSSAAFQAIFNANKGPQDQIAKHTKKAADEAAKTNQKLQDIKDKLNPAPLGQATIP